MMRSSSRSNIKQSRKKCQDQRTTKTKASIKKPDDFRINLSRNKNNHNPALFSSQNKSNHQKKYIYHQPQHQTKTNKSNITNTVNAFQQINTKISLDYINSLYSNLGIQLGCRLRHSFKRVNKENELNQMNIFTPFKDEKTSKDEKECWQKILNIFKLKQDINQFYNAMKNTQNILSYTVDKQNQLIQQKHSQKQTYNITDHQSVVSSFLKNYRSAKKQLEYLETRHGDSSNQKQPIQIEIQNKKIEIQQKLEIQNKKIEIQQKLDLVIDELKSQIINEKKLCLRYQKEQSFLLKKLYFTQNKNNQLRMSSSHLKIKNTNLKDTIKFSLPIRNCTTYHPEKLQRSLSLKLQRIKKYNFKQGLISFIQYPKTQKKLEKSRSTSSLNTAPRQQIILRKKKQTFLDKIY